jgi:alpha/beta superfamily hydrolase
MNKVVIYNHGKDSQPWSEKTEAFTEVAKHHGYEVQSPDYRNQLNPDERVKQLLSIDLSDYVEIVLIGSSMGAYVATVAAETIKPKGLFLLAPAIYLPGYQRTEFNFSNNSNVCVVHGWQDDIVPPENAWKFCQQYHLRLKMYDADHRLLRVITEVTKDFEDFLAR